MAKSKNTESIGNIIKICLSVSLVSALLLSFVHLSLKDLQNSNAKIEEIKNIIIISGLLGDDVNYNVDISVDKIYSLYEKLSPIFFDVKEKKLLPINTKEEDLDINLLEEKIVLSKKEDIAFISDMPRIQKGYLVKKNGSINKIILPIYGYGLWSTIYGYLALEKDLNTVFAISFYDHAETPGLGAKVSSIKWMNTWQGKKVYNNDNSNPILKLVKGGAKSDYELDALSGATLTSLGVNNMINWWFANSLYGKLLIDLKNLK